jgi:hypothetical protein
MFPPGDMLSLCPVCHQSAHKGEWSENHLRDLKLNPYNKSQTAGRFLIESDKLIFNLGGNRFVNSPRIVIVNDFELVTINKEDGGFLTLNLVFYDRFNKLVGMIDENRWAVDTSLTWDLEYKSKNLKIKNVSRQISFELGIHNGEVFVTADLFFLGHPILIRNNEILIESNNIFGSMKGCTIEDGSGNVVNVQLGNVDSGTA